MKAGYIRRAHHAGSWYSSDRATLNETLASFLKDAETEATSSSSSDESSSPLRAVICPHAGYSYSGPTAAFSYYHLQQELNRPNSPIKTILVLHPSHHFYLNGCAVSGASYLETPLGNLQVDDDIRQELLILKNSGSSHDEFSIMEQGVDEREHSGEMQYPYIAKAAASSTAVIKVLPIMCGNISKAQEEGYGKVLAPIVARPEICCVISTDFCHWGKRFQYQPAPASTSSLEIHQHIRELDHQGMRHIELQEPGAFATYLKQTRNTICGRHAIAVWLNAVHCNSHGGAEVLDIAFVRYEQSSQVTSMRDSSVSYGSATARRRAETTTSSTAT